jgi:Ca2+-binding RTX toxin-like protein
MTGAVVDVNPVTIAPAILGDLYANKNDTLYDTAGNDYIVSGTGNDQVFASAGGSDIIDGGIGQDIVYGGLGNDVIFGGPDGDILVGEDGNDRLYVNGQVTVADAIAAGNSQTGTGTRGDWLAGGTGNDTLVGGNANDALFGGGAQDLLNGGAGVSSSVVKLRLGSLLLDLSNGDTGVSCKRGLAQSTVRRMTNSPRFHSIINYKNNSALIFERCRYCHLKQVAFKGIAV